MNHPLQSPMPDAAPEQAGELGRIATGLAGLHASIPFADTNVFSDGGGQRDRLARPAGSRRGRVIRLDRRELQEHQNGNHCAAAYMALKTQ